MPKRQKRDQSIEKLLIRPIVGGMVKNYFDTLSDEEFDDLFDQMTMLLDPSLTELKNDERNLKEFWLAGAVYDARPEMCTDIARNLLMNMDPEDLAVYDKMYQDHLNMMEDIDDDD